VPLLRCAAMSASRDVDDCGRRKGSRRASIYCGLDGQIESRLEQKGVCSKESKVRGEKVSKQGKRTCINNEV